MSETLYAPEELLQNKKELVFDVMTARYNVSSSSKTEDISAEYAGTDLTGSPESSPIKKLKTDNQSNAKQNSPSSAQGLEEFHKQLKDINRGLDSSGSFILDIDLDFFSCLNPFKEMYSEKAYSLLQTLYHYELPKETDDKVNKFFVCFCLCVYG